MALKFAMIVQLIDRLSGPGKQARRSNAELTKSVRDLGRATPAAARGMDRLARSGDNARNRLGVRLFSKIRQLAGPMGMKALEKGAYGAGRAIGFTIRKVAELAVTLAKVAAASVIVGGTAMLGGIIATTAKFEQFQIMLEGTEGSAEKAKKAMAWVQDFAKRTPYELDQVMEAFVQLKAYGIDPMSGALTSAGDAASGMSKPLMQAIEALADAQTGEFERLKEFAITTKVEGNKVAFTYVKNGKEITRQTVKNATAMREAITGIWDDRFGGGMARQAWTLHGIVNNLKDMWTGFLLRVGQAGVFDKVKGKLEGLLNWLNKRLDDGSIDKWAKSVSIELEKIVDRIGNINAADLANFAGDLKTIAKSGVDIVNALGQVLGLVNRIDRAWAGVDAFVDRWGVGGPGWGDYFRGRTPMFDQGAGRPDQRSRPTSRPSASGAPARAPATGIRARPMNPAFLRTPGAQKVSVGGSMDIRVRADPGLSARPGKMSSANSDVPLVYRGGALTGHG